ncbi:hypothetical protein J1N35_036310 [Gossypium stocksii]|uniref:Plastocyanin-like domain-containing protein n=1 Tax=Gossypium stocksii TaxID=47602 RepID=A0A9D3ZJV0_9ROSI|nr:hypothetical protein J1N35_036310 [Gossypium stocksii]
MKALQPGIGNQMLTQSTVIGCSKDTTYEQQVDYQGYYLYRIVNAWSKKLWCLASHTIALQSGRNGAYTPRSFANSLTLAPGHTLDVLLYANQNLAHYYIGPVGEGKRERDEVRRAFYFILY